MKPRKNKILVMFMVLTLAIILPMNGIDNYAFAAPKGGSDWDRSSLVFE